MLATKYAYRNSTCTIRANVFQALPAARFASAARASLRPPAPPQPSRRKPSTSCRRMRSSSQVRKEGICQAGQLLLHTYAYASNYVPRIERDLGGEVASDGIHPPPARGRLRRDGRRHEGGRADGGILQPEKGNETSIIRSDPTPKRLASYLNYLVCEDPSPGEPERGRHSVRVPVVLHQGGRDADRVPRSQHSAGHPAGRLAHPERALRL